MTLELEAEDLCYVGALIPLQELDVGLPVPEVVHKRVQDKI